MSINTVSITGNIVKTPELKSTGTGSVLPFTVAVNQRKKTASGEWTDEANFFDCVLFGKRAESLAQYMLKGTKVGVSGRLNQNKWRTKEGENRYSVNIVVSDIDLMSRGGTQAHPAPQAPVAPSAPVAPQAPVAPIDVPFDY